MTQMARKLHPPRFSLVSDLFILAYILMHNLTPTSFEKALVSMRRVSKSLIQLGSIIYILLSALQG